MGKRPIFPDVHDEQEKATFIARGASALDLKEHAAEVGTALMVIKRINPASPPPVPSVAHMSFNHFTALVATDGAGNVRLQDRHLDFDGMLTPAASSVAFSGNFLVPAGAVPAGYATVPDGDAANLLGRHCRHGEDKEDRPRCTVGGNQSDCPMATYGFTKLDAGLVVQDVPIVVPCPVGPSVVFKLVYDQTTPAGNSLTGSGFGARWRHSYQAHLRVPTTNSTEIEYDPGNGALYSYTKEGARWKPKYKEYDQLEEIVEGTTVVGYKLTDVMGSSQSFKKKFNSDKFLLSEITDEHGNSLTLKYTGNKLTSLVDALGQVTLIGYASTTDTLIRSVTVNNALLAVADRLKATFAYDASKRLVKITDPVAISSVFTYGTSDFINSILTPYGKTTFTAGTISDMFDNPAERSGIFIEAKDPAGDIERIEQSDLARGTLGEQFGAPNPIDVGGTMVSFQPKNDNLDYRNTFLLGQKSVPPGWQAF
jgi:hypothetical protein